MAAGPEMGAVGTEGRLASDMCIEQRKKESHLHQIWSVNNILGMLLVEITVCASVGESPCAACVHCACASACAAGLGSCTSMAGCIEASFSQGERGFFFSPLLGQNQGDCAAPRLSPDASKRERLHITQRAGCSSDAPAGR